MIALAFLLALVLLPCVPAGAEETAQERTVELAREFTDPLTTLPQLSLQDVYTPSNYGTEAESNRLLLRAIIPRIPRFSLFPFVQLIRPTFQLVTVPTGRGKDTRTELGDTHLIDAIVIPWPEKEYGLMLAVGPVFSFPTATDKLAGEGSWQAGPAFASVYKGIPGLLLGCLVQNPISFAYTSSDRQPVSRLLFQPIVLLHLKYGFYLKSADSTWVRGWRKGSSSIVPLSLGLGYVFVRSGMPPVNLFVTGEWTAYRSHAPFAPQTTVRFGLIVAFPYFRLWE